MSHKAALDALWLLFYGPEAYRECSSTSPLEDIGKELSLLYRIVNSMVSVRLRTTERIRDARPTSKRDWQSGLHGERSLEVVTARMVKR